MDRGAQWAMVCGIAKKLDMTERQTLSLHFHIRSNRDCHGEGSELGLVPVKGVFPILLSMLLYGL